MKGGVSSEREVSLRSGAAIAQGLRERGYEVDEVDVVAKDFSIPAGVEAVFVALHGTFGEDGEVQQVLEKMKMPYTGSNAESCRIAFDKVLTRERLEANGIPVPRGEVLTVSEDRKMPLPLVVKPPREGSSVGCHLVFDETEWEAAFSDAVRYSGAALVEEYIPGRELTVGVIEQGAGMGISNIEQGIGNVEGDGKLAHNNEDLGRERTQGTQKNKEHSGMESLSSMRSFAATSKTGGGLQVLPVVEIKTASEWYDFEAKYVTGDTQYTVPAELPPETTAELQAIALKTFRCLEAEGFGRVDFRLSPEGKPYVLELNSIPGFTATSLLPKAAESAGIGFSELCCRIMQLAHL